MHITIGQQALIEEAEAMVRRFIEERGEFQMFSLAKHADGKFNAVQPTNEFADQRGAMIETIKVLMSLAREGQIVGNVLCTPVNEDGQRLAILDVEHKEDGRVLAFLPYKKRFFGGWSFGEKLYKSDAPKLFAA